MALPRKKKLIFRRWHPKRSTNFRVTISNKGHLLVFNPDPKDAQVRASFEGEVVLIWLLIDGLRSEKQIWYHCKGRMELELFQDILKDLKFLELIK
jgi:hypothetical protein